MEYSGNNEPKRISVALATYNGEAYIAAQLESILNQEMEPEEIVVCDDLSTDNTVAILSNYESKAAIRLFINEQRLGITGNFRKAVSLCKADNYVALSDQDDVWLSSKLQTNYDHLRSIDNGKTPALAYSDLSLVDEQLDVIQPSFQKVLNVDPSRENFSTLLFGNIVTGCTVMMNRAMRDFFCNMPDSKRITMHDAWLGLIAYSFGKHVFCSTPLLLYRQHGNNVTYETNKGNSFAKRIQQSISQFSSNKDYLRKEIEQAKLFKELYEARLDAADLKTISDFISLEKASFLYKKYSSILARRYRYLKDNK